MQSELLGDGADAPLLYVKEPQNLSFRFLRNYGTHLDQRGGPRGGRGARVAVRAP